MGPSGYRYTGDAGPVLSRYCPVLHSDGGPGFGENRVPSRYFPVLHPVCLTGLQIGPHRPPRVWVNCSYRRPARRRVVVVSSPLNADLCCQSRLVLPLHRDYRCHPCPRGWFRGFVLPVSVRYSRSGRCQKISANFNGTGPRQLQVVIYLVDLYVALGTQHNYLIDLIRRYSSATLHLEHDIESY